LGFSSSSSSEERTTTRFWRFAGGAMASRLVVRRSVLPQSMFVWRAGADTEPCILGVRCVIRLLISLARPLKLVLNGSPVPR
jgi:hypothetical protein